MGDLWRAAPPYSKRMAAVLWPAGAVLVGVGIFGDSEGFWQNHGFVGNLTSGLTSFCFAVPVALLFLEPRADMARAEALQAEVRVSESRASRSFLNSLRQVMAGQARLRSDLERDTSSTPYEIFTRFHSRRGFSVSELEGFWELVRSFRSGRAGRDSALWYADRTIRSVIDDYRKLSEGNGAEWPDEEFRDAALRWSAMDLSRVKDAARRWERE